MIEISRKAYCDMYGPTVGDRVRLGDTSLIAEVEKDLTVHGDEAKFGGGIFLLVVLWKFCKATDKECLDTVITNALIIDSTGIIKADVGIKDGRIAGIGKAGNPDIMNGVDKNMIIGASTEAIAGEGLILTAGGLDTHIHFISPTQVRTALYSGITTMIGGGTGPADGTNATTCTPGEFNIHRMLEASEDLPMNFGYLCKGNSSDITTLEEQIKAGCIGLKIHEDWGSTPDVIDHALTVADMYDVQAAIHTDTLNEGGFVEDTVNAFKGRTIHTYHTEGAGGGHAPDIIRAAAFPNVLPSSTNPKMPNTANTHDEFSYVSDAFNSMIAKLEKSFEKEKQFTSDAAHELRTPISVIQSHCEYCLDELKLTDSVREEIEIIYKKTPYSGQLVSQLLTISRTDKHRFKPQKEEEDLTLLIESDIEELQQKAAYKNISLLFEYLPQNESYIIQGDTMLLMRMIYNLIENAINYGIYGGCVWVNLIKNQENTDIIIKENGIGIEKEHLDKIWIRFYRVDKSRSAGEGFGLGLSMVRFIVDIHNGSIVVKSKPGYGTIFTVSL